MTNLSPLFVYRIEAGPILPSTGTNPLEVPTPNPQPLERPLTSAPRFPLHTPAGTGPAASRLVRGLAQLSALSLTMRITGPFGMSSPTLLSL